MRWTPSKILKVAGLTLIGLTPFVLAFLLLPSGDEQPEAEESPTAAANVTIPLAFPSDLFSSPTAPPSPEPEPAPTPSPTNRQCNNRRDDDRDGKVDTADPGCSSRTDNSEAPDPSPAPSASPSPSPSPEPPVLNCEDNFDNDGDDLPDGADPGCADDGNELPVNDRGPTRPPEGPPTPPTPPTAPTTTTTTTTAPPASSTAANGGTSTTTEPE